MTTNRNDAENGGTAAGMILIVSDDAACSQRLIAAWADESDKPTLTLMSGDICAHSASEEFDIAIVVNVSQEHLGPVLRSLEIAGRPVLLASDSATQIDRAESLIVIEQKANWHETVKLLAEQALRRVQAEQRAGRAEEISAELESKAALGRYMLEMRHTLNNALTSVLGNSELLLLDGQLSENAIGQVETVRTMAVRMHEIFQRFTSLEKELTAVSAQQKKKTRLKAYAATT